MFKAIGSRLLFNLIFAIGLMTLMSCNLVKKLAKDDSTQYVEVNYQNQKLTLPVNMTIQPMPGVTKLEDKKTNTEKVEVVELNEQNSITMDQVFTDESVNKVMNQFSRLSNSQPKDKVLYLVLNSPGGSVDAGLSLITFIKALPQDVKTISIFSASMSFQTSQNLGERLVLPNSTVMSHRAKFGISGEAPGEMFSRLKYIMSQLTELDQIAANRMGMSFDTYQKLISDEYWSYGRNAVAEKSADRLILAKCSKEMLGTKTTLVSTMFGDFNVKISKCPLIPGIVSVSAPENASQENINYVKMMFTNKKSFVEDFALTNKWSKIQKIY